MLLPNAVSLWAALQRDTICHLDAYYRCRCRCALAGPASTQEGGAQSAGILVGQAAVVPRPSLPATTSRGAVPDWQHAPWQPLCWWSSTGARGCCRKQGSARHRQLNTPTNERGLEAALGRYFHDECIIKPPQMGAAARALCLWQERLAGFEHCQAAHSPPGMPVGGGPRANGTS